MCDSSIKDYVKELEVIKNSHPEHLEYIADCEKFKIQPRRICERINSRMQILQLIGDDKELLEIYDEFKDQLNNPEMILEIIKSYITAIKVIEDNPKIGISKKMLRASIGNITNILAIMQKKIL